MSDKLTGAFSGLWSCEICGETGTGCTCEHFARWGYGHGPYKELTGPEIAAEYWRSAYLFESTQTDEHAEQWFAIARLGGADADEQ